MNKVMKSRKYVVFLLLLLAMVVGTAVVHAITIAVDGVREAVWDTGSGVQLPGIQNDINEVDITDGYDIEQFLWTNDQDNMYFLMQTFATTIWTGTPIPTLVVCIDTDNNTTTGGSYANCNNMIGIDRSIVYTRANFNGTVLTGTIYDGDPNAGIPIAGASGARLATGRVNEVAMSLTDLGINSSSACINNMRAAIYFDNGISDPDDRTPDSGTFTIGCGTPTAVNLQSFTPAGNSTLPVVAFIGFLALVIVSFGVVIVRREQRKA